MNIAIIGTGYVGLSTGVSLAEIGHKVTCIDIDKRKIESLNKCVSPIFEPGLETLLKKNIEKGNLVFTTSYQNGLVKAEIIVVAVGTPERSDGSADLSYLEQAVRDVCSYLNKDAIIVIKSTVPVGTNDYIKTLIKGECRTGINIVTVSNPEFLRQGSAVQDTLKADRIIIGSDQQEAAKKIAEMYRPLAIPVILTDTRSAEMIKYASNAFLALKISFINEIANLCELVGADVLDVAKGMGLDHRIGGSFLQAGIGYGGSCFPKDIQALHHFATAHGKNFSLLSEIIRINQAQQERLVKKALKRFKNLKGKNFAMLGLSFKPETDDMRGAPSIKIANLLTKHGANVIAYDPVATDKARQIIGDKITYAVSIQDAVSNTDALFIVTEWNEFREMDLELLLKKMKQPIVFDGRNCLEESKINKCSKLEYYPIGRPEMIIDHD